MTYATLPITDKALLNSVAHALENAVCRADDYGIVRLQDEPINGGELSAILNVKRVRSGDGHVTPMETDYVLSDVAVSLIMDADAARPELAEYVNRNWRTML